jgi:orotidine-5'-phosphate decarboxylase
MTHYADRLHAAILRTNTTAVVGIDPVLAQLPPALRDKATSTQTAAAVLEEFSRAVIEAVTGVAPAVKINSGFFEAYYEHGVAAYFRCVAAARRAGLLVIGDIKRGDIGNTANEYAAGHLGEPTFADRDPLTVPDAVTVSGYLGSSSLAPFVRHAKANGRGVYVLVRPSEPTADLVHDFGGPAGRFYQHMAELVRTAGADAIGECGLSCIGAVVAAKDAESTRALRAAMPTTPWLVPGYGAQGGTAAAVAPCLAGPAGSAVIAASRSVIYAFSNEKFRATHGDNWQASIAAAAVDFVKELPAK